MLLEAVVSRSRQGLWLAAVPVLMFGALLGSLWLATLLPGPSVSPARLLIAALWSWWSVRILPARAHGVASWLRTRVNERGGEADPSQPVHSPSALEVNARNAPAMLASLEAVRLSFMRRPGQESRRMLAVAGAALWLPSLTSAAIDDHGTLARAAIALCAVLATIATMDLYRGHERRWSRPWRATTGPWPHAWQVTDRPSKVLGPIWLILALLGFAATVPISHAESVTRGVTLTFLLIAPLTVLWMGRHQLGWLAALERTDSHRILARWMVRMAPATWIAALAVQLALVVLGLSAIALSPLDASASYVGILVLGIALMFRSMRRDWQRPRQPALIDLDEIASLFGERHLERRVSGVLMLSSFVSGIWAYLLTAAG